MRRFALAACVLSAASLVGCGGGGAAMSLPSGRQVVVNSDRALRTIRCENTTGGVNATIGPRTVVVRPTEIEVDGAAVAAIPQDAQVIAIAEFDGRLMIEADRDRVYDAEF
jgi:hypothetical protein